ncbi:hypothetical protein AB0L82_43225 [Nocardia sp. NPDC052001]|uniref:hypothetical protein n=1 Tax=Nocardia sp. NPDC052001 TaxID=3154853 RepID=UPI00343773DC
MFRRKPNPDRTKQDRGGNDPLLTADLPDRVATGRDRLAYQDDPALREALSERELHAERELAEREREHRRTQKLAELTTAEATAVEVHKTTTEIVQTEARDLLMSRRALADQRRESSPHAQLAQLYRIKKWSGRALAGVVAGAMLYSAANVQHNLAPGGPSEPLFWMSYLLEALISTVLVVFMVSGSAVARWKITEGEKAIQWTEAALLLGSILLNTYPYLRSPQDWSSVAVHSVAPVMMGVALFAHQAVAKRMGAAIAQASLEITSEDDTTERLAALLDRARTIAAQPPAPERGIDPRADEVVLADFEREFDESESRAQDTAITPSRAREPIVARAMETVNDVAREGVARASLAREESETPRAEFIASRASEDVSSVAREEDPAREEDAVEAARSRAEQLDNELAQIQVQRRQGHLSRAAHSPTELGTESESLADREEEAAPLAREEQEAIARDLTPVVALVRAPQPPRATRETAPRSSRATHAPIARETSVDGALARATDPVSRATTIARDTAGSGPFARELTPVESTRLARAVHDRRKSKQPVEVLAKIYLAKSQGMTTNAIGDTVGLPHSTVGRAIDAAVAVSGPRSVD